MIYPTVIKAMNSEHDSSDLLCITLSSSSRKRPRLDFVTTITEGKKHSVSYSTYVKWQCDFDKKCQTILWLDCNVTGKEGKRIGLLID